MNPVIIFTSSMTFTTILKSSTKHCSTLLGDVRIYGDINFSVVSDLDGPTPQFRLTCISTGGPATTVTWTRDSTTVTGGSVTVLNNPETAEYIHFLTVTGKNMGLYVCTVANNKPSHDSASIVCIGKRYYDRIEYYNNYLLNQVPQ